MFVLYRLSVVQFYVQIHLFICALLELSPPYYDLLIMLFPLIERHVFLLIQQAVTTLKNPGFVSLCLCV